MKFNGLHASILEQQLFDIIYKLKILKEPDLGLNLRALQAALSAGLNNFGSPSTLIIDPNAFDSLKSITFNDQSLIKETSFYDKKVKKKKLK